LRIAAQVKEDRWVINLQQVLRIFRFGPIQQAATGNIADACQFFFRAFESILIIDSLRHTRRQAARLQFRERRVKYAIRRSNLAQQTGTQAARQPESQRQREPGEGSV
jgi:hypothetical protein